MIKKADEWISLKSEMEKAFFSYSSLEMSDKDLGLILNRLTELQNKINKLSVAKQKLKSFVDMLESHTEDWDDLCDCPYGDGEETDSHYPNCRTINIRKDLEEALEVKSGDDANNDGIPP